MYIIFIIFSQMVIRTRAFLWNEDGKLLVLKHRKENDWWALPGGKMEGKESSQQCIERELFEELGIRVSPRLVMIQELLRIDSLEFLFTAQVQSSDIVKDAECAYEFAEMQWVDSLHNDLVVYPLWMKDAEYMKKVLEGKEVQYIFDELA